MWCGHHSNISIPSFYYSFISQVAYCLVVDVRGAKVEWDANVYASVKIWAPWMLQIGHRACLGSEVI